MKVRGCVPRLVVALAVAVAVGGCGWTESNDQSAPAPAAGRNRFEISLDTGGPMAVTAAAVTATVVEDGKPASNVEVSVELRMPATPTMGEMRTGAELTADGEGRYRGTVDVLMAGQWNAIVRVKRDGAVVATHMQPVTAAQ